MKKCYLALLLILAFLLFGCSPGVSTHASSKSANSISHSSGQASVTSSSVVVPSSSAEQKEKYTYYIDELSADQIVSDIMAYINTPPTQGQTKESYTSSLKAQPVDIIHNSGFGGIRVLFKDEKLGGDPKKDVIEEIVIDGAYYEMDGSIGVKPNNSGGNHFGVHVKFVMMDYKKAVAVYEGLFNQLSPYYKNIEDPRQGTWWQARGSVQINPNFGYGDVFVSMMKRDDNTFIMSAGRVFPQQ